MIKPARPLGLFLVQRARPVGRNSGDSDLIETRQMEHRDEGAKQN